MAFRPGESIAGRYEVESVIASGGMGVIYAARHLVLGERVAIKCLLPELSADAEQAARLIGEARAAAKIRSEHVTRIIDADRLPDGTVFLAMEHLDGCDLKSMLDECQTLPIDTAIAYVLQAGEALAEAHAYGIVHRDLKPANLFAARRADGSTCIKVLDFGISKVLPHEAQVRTRTGIFMGTPMYASPEQLTTPSDVDLRTDIWALGCVLHELLTGQPPFVRETMAALIAAIVSTPAGSVTAKRADVPPAVDAAIARCLEKDRDRRWSSIGELAAVLGPFSPMQAAQSVPRIVALTPPSSRPSLAPSLAATVPSSAAGPAFAPTISVVPPAPVSNAHVSATAQVSVSAPRASTTARWIVAGIVAAGVVVAGAGGVVVARRVRRAPPVVAALETAATTSSAAPAVTAPPSAPPSAPAAPTPIATEPAGAADAGPQAVAPKTEGAASPSRNGGLRAATPARSGARRVSAPTSSAGKSNDWNMPIKE